MENLLTQHKTKAADKSTLTPEDLVVYEKVEKILDMFRPVLLEEGGDARLLTVTDGVAYIDFGGGCEGCGSALASLEGGVKLTLKEKVPGLREIVFQ